MADVKTRVENAVLGALVADAAVSPLHWIYSREKMDEILAEANGKPEFYKWSVPYYQLPVGAFSCYGDQAYCMLHSLVENKGFILEKYAQDIYKFFGPSSPYKDPNPSSKEEYPKKGPWINGNVKKSLENLNAGKLQEGSDEAEADCFSKVIALVAVYAGDSELNQKIEQAVRTTLNNDKSVNVAIAYGQLLETVILTGDFNVGEWCNNLTDGHVKEEIKAVLQKKDTNHIEAAKGFGVGCSLPGSFQNTIHCLIQGKDYVESVRLALSASGGNCARAMAVGALLAAKNVNTVPTEWIDKTSRGKEVAKLAKSLFEQKS